MNTITKKLVPSSPAIREIKRLHDELISAAQNSLIKAIRIGELLTRQKESLKHGEWLPWLKSNAPFSERTAQNYLRVFERREELKNASVADLGEAYRLLAPPGEPDNDGLAAIETRIATGMPELDEARKALIEIRDKELWREKFNSFGDYIGTLDKDYADFLLSEVHEIQLDKIILDETIYCRANGVESAVVSDYAKAMRDGEQFPPVDIFETEKGLVCADGWHRIHAAKRAGFKTIQATVHVGSFKDCVRFALGANAKHGWRRAAKSSALN